MPKWKEDYDWVHYDEVTKDMFCIICEKYDFTNKSSHFVIGCTSYRLDSLKTHDKSASHIDASRKEQIAIVKAEQKIVVCSYTGDIETQSISEADQAITGYSKCSWCSGLCP